MRTYHYHASLIGFCFLQVTAAGLINAVVLGPIFAESDLLGATRPSVSEIRAGALLNTLMAISIVAIAVLVLPILAQTSQIMALGYLVARLAEGIILTIAGSLWLILLPSNGATTETATVTLFLSVILFGIGAQIVFGLTAIILNASLLQSNLVPRIISVWGLMGGILVLGLGIGTVLSAEIGHLEPYLTAPIALNELVPTLWLIVKGFRM